jgi:lipopolysaccharide assembly outer membrane protein LptD (OstA)
VSGRRAYRRLAGWLGAAVALWLAVAPALPATALAQSEIPVTLRANTFQYDRTTKILVAAGDVVVTYQDVVIKADRLRANLETNDVRAQGNVTIEVGRYQARGTALDYNLTTRQGRIEQAATEYKGPYVLGTVYVRAQVVDGTFGSATFGRSGVCTTCEGPNPLVYLTAGELSFYPNDKIVGRRVGVWIGGRRIVTWPYFIIYLREQRASRLLPVVGYSQTEGYFLKTFYSYAINPDHYGYLRLDLMERLGIGYGVEHTYRWGGGNGTLFLYRLENKQSGGSDSRVVVNHQQRLGDVTARLYTDYLTRYDPLFPETSVYGSLDAFTRTRASSTTLYQSYSSFDIGVVRLSTYTARLIHAQQITRALSAEVVGDFSRTSSALGADDELLPRLTLRYRGAGYLVTLTADGRVDLDGDRFPFDQRFGVERLPELTVAVDPRLLRGTRLVYQAQVGVGRFRETLFAGTTDAVRADSTITLSGPLFQSDQGFLDLRAQLRGSYYSTGDARGFVSGRLNYTRFLGPNWQAQAGMTYQDQVGQTPFSFDRTLGRISQADATVTYRRSDLIVTGTTSFDASTGVWAPAVVRAQYAPRPGWIIASALSYNPSLGLLDRAELSFDVKLNPLWQVGYYGYYDGITGRIYHDRLTVTRIWEDCLATSLTYRGTTNEIWLETWLTALPWARGRVGVGSQGNILFDQPWLGPRP